MDMQNNVIYYRKSRNVDYVCYQNTMQSYPMHTHANHAIIGYVAEGMVCVVCDGQEYIYDAGGCFCIMPDIPHTIKPVNDSAYSMISVCVSVDQIQNAAEKKDCYEKRLKQIILNAPEKVFRIQDMAQSVSVSPYHMLRQFKAVCGLTPHQFQIQCRVRKAQKLLEAGKSVTEVAYDTGFCDQSHFDRCFRKIVRLTPNEYKHAVK